MLANDPELRVQRILREEADYGVKAAQRRLRPGCRDAGISHARGNAGGLGARRIGTRDG